MKKKALKHQTHKTTFLPSPVARGGGRRSITALAVAACFGVVPATVLAAPEEKKQMTDQAITNAVDHTLQTDSALLNHQIEATTSEGIVTLSGTAAHLLAKDRATKLSETICGMRSVVNAIRLDTPARTDDEIRKDVESAFLYDAATDSYELTPAAQNGVETISGTAKSVVSAMSISTAMTGPSATSS